MPNKKSLQTMAQTSTGNVLRDLQNELSEVQNNHSTVITAKGRRFPAKASSEIAGVSTGSRREHDSCYLVSALDIVAPGGIFWFT